MIDILHPQPRLAILAGLRSGVDISRSVHTMLITISCGGALYGAALGWWHGPILSAYVAVKIPVLLLATAAATAAFNFVFAAVAGLPLRFDQVFGLTLFPLAIASVVAASLAPVALLFSHTMPPPAPGQQTLHNVMYLTHTALIAGAGLAGTSFLRHALTDVCAGDMRLAGRIRAVWVAVYAFTAGEIAWALRPFVGSVHLPVVFLREDALDGNVYEFILTDIIPHLLRQMGGQP